MLRIHSLTLFLLGAIAPTNAFSTVSQRSTLVTKTFRPSATFLRYRSNVTDAEVVDVNVNVNLNVFAEQQASPLQGLFLTQEDVCPPPLKQEHKEEGMSDVLKARLLLLGAAALYGTNFSLVKILGETGMSVGLSSTLRFGMAALATLPWLLTLDDESDKDNRFQKLFDPKGVEFQAALGGLEVGMWNSIGYVAQAVGLETTSASKSAFLCSLAVVIVPILDYIAGRTLLSRQVVGAMLAVVGVGFLELDGTGMSMQTLSGGDIASLIQPIAFGLGFWRMESAMQKFPEEADRATAAQLMAVFLGSGAYMMAMSVADPSSLPSTDQFVSWVTDPTILAALFWTGVVTTALTIYMETLALKTLSAAETTLIFSTEPLWGTAFASVVMGETLGMNAGFGAVMILSGCVFSNLGISGLMSFLPGFFKNNSNDAEAMNRTTNRQIERFELLDQTQISSANILPTDTVGKLSLRSAVAGALTGVVALVETASGSPPSVQPDELKEFLENLNN